MQPDSCFVGEFMVLLVIDELDDGLDGIDSLASSSSHWALLENQ